MDQHGSERRDQSDTWLSRARRWARRVKRDVIALWLAARDPRVPWIAKAVSAAVVAYALSPIDLIPDFVPVLGLLDDLLIVPLGIMLAVRLVPAALMIEFRFDAEHREVGSSRAGFLFVLAIWGAVLFALGTILFRKVAGY